MTKTYYGTEPLALETVTIGKFKHIYYRENITEFEKDVEGETVTEWSADEYTHKVSADTEVTPQLIDAIKEADRIVTAKKIREERNKLLQDSDNQMVSDRPTDKEAWAAYRQALRDLTEQPGFPYDVAFPVVPV